MTEKCIEKRLNIDRLITPFFITIIIIIGIVMYIWLMI